MLLEYFMKVLMILNLKDVDIDRQTDTEKKKQDKRKYFRLLLERAERANLKIP